MKPENRELLIRAVGVIDGLCYTAPDPIGEGLVAVLEMLDKVLESEDTE